MDATAATLTTTADSAARALAFARKPAPGPRGSEGPAHVVAALGLSPQQQRLVELILAGKGDKQIAREMGVGLPTVRTYLTRVFQRTGTAGRIELVARVFACAHEWRRQKEEQQQQQQQQQQQKQTGGHRT